VLNEMLRTKGSLWNDRK